MAKIKLENSGDKKPKHGGADGLVDLARGRGSLAHWEDKNRRRTVGIQLASPSHCLQIVSAPKTGATQISGPDGHWRNFRGGPDTLCLEELRKMVETDEPQAGVCPCAPGLRNCNLREPPQRGSG